MRHRSPSPSRALVRLYPLLPEQPAKTRAQVSKSPSRVTRPRCQGKQPLVLDPRTF